MIVRDDGSYNNNVINWHKRIRTKTKLKLMKMIDMKYTTRFLVQIVYLVLQQQYVYSQVQQQGQDTSQSCSIMTLLQQPSLITNTIRTIDVDQQLHIITSYNIATQLALDHLNERNNVIVSNLADVVQQFCPNLYFTTTPIIFDNYETYNNNNMNNMIETILQANQTISNLCGMIGPILLHTDSFGNSSVSSEDSAAIIHHTQNQQQQQQLLIESSIMANVIRVPQILTQSSYDYYYNDDTSNSNNRNTIRNFIHVNDYCNIVIDYCINELMIQYMVIIVPSDSALNHAMSETLLRANSLESNRTVDYRVISTSKQNNMYKNDSNTNSYWYDIFNTVKNTGIRYIYIDEYESITILHDMANVLHEMNMLNGEYFYIFGSGISSSSLVFDVPSTIVPNNVHRLLHGSIWIGQVDPFVLEPESNRFLQIWQQRQKQLNGNTSFIQNITSQEYMGISQLPYLHSSYIYDSIISLGLGQCHASTRLDDNNDTTTKEYHSLTNFVVRNIVENVSFDGASGFVKYKLYNDMIYRDSAVGLHFVVYNIRAATKSTNISNAQQLEYFIVSQKVSDQPWTKVIDKSMTPTANGSIQYADSTYEAPQQFVYANMNYISDPVFIFGLVLFAIGGCFAILCFCLVSYYEGDALLKISQPLFLKIICIGSMIEVCTIFTSSFDENRRWSNNALDAMCVTSKWFFFLGHATIYAAIFCKLWRVDRVMTARRRRVTYLQVIRPLILLFLGIVIVLVVWTSLDPLRWTRSIVADVQPPESIGKCTCQYYAAYFYTCTALIGVPTFLTIIVVWRTRDISQDLSDASLTFYLVVTQFQAWLLGIPVLIVLGETSIDAKYLSQVLLIWIFSVAPLLIVVCPSLYRTVQHRRQRDGKRKQRLLGSGLVHVSGLNGIGSTTLTMDDKINANAKCKRKCQPNNYDDSHDLTLKRESKESSSGYSDPKRESMNHSMDDDCVEATV